MLHVQKFKSFFLFLFSSYFSFVKNDFSLEGRKFCYYSLVPASCVLDFYVKNLVIFLKNLWKIESSTVLSMYCIVHEYASSFGRVFKNIQGQQKKVKD